MARIKLGKHQTYIHCNMDEIDVDSINNAGKGKMHNSPHFGGYMKYTLGSVTVFIDQE